MGSEPLQSPQQQSQGAEGTGSHRRKGEGLAFLHSCAELLQKPRGKSKRSHQNKKPFRYFSLSHISHYKKTLHHIYPKNLWLQLPQPCPADRLAFLWNYTNPRLSGQCWGLARVVAAIVSSVTLRPSQPLQASIFPSVK